MATMDYSKSSPFSQREGEFLNAALVPHTYNVTESSMLKVRSKVARAQGGVTHNIILMGHSYIAGSNSVPGTNDFCTALKKSLKVVLGDEYVHTGIVHFKNKETRDNRYSAVSAGWVVDDPMVCFASCVVADAELTFTSDTVGTTVQIATFENSAAFTYSIDGAAPVAVTSISGNAFVRIINVNGLANTTHTVRIIATTASSTYFVGAGVVNPGSGLRITNQGFGGSHAYEWSPALALTKLHPVSKGTVPTRDIVVLQMDTNDIRNGQTVSQWTASMRLILTNEKNAGAGIILIMSVDAPGSGNLTYAQWDAYYQAGYALADEYNIPMLDTRHLFGGWSGAVAMALTGDTLHPNAGGYKLTANALAKLLTS